MTLARPVGPDDHVLGRPDAPLTLLEYGDYQCPYCRRAHPIVRALRSQLAESLRYVWRHFPLTQVHPAAQLAAESAEAAGVQDRFWPMHEQLLENQAWLGRDLVVRLAMVLGLDVARFERDLREGRLRERVRQDFMSGVRSGVGSTPGFFIDGDRYDGAIELEALRLALQQRLADEGRAPGASGY